MKNLKSLFQISLASIFLYACNNVGTEYGYGHHDWDVDKDEVITTVEYNEKWDEIGYYDDWDADTSGTVDREEWNEAIEKHFSDWDADKRDKMNFDDWDINKDEVLEDEELANATFKLWDTDGDGEIDVVEYEEWARSEEE